MRLHKEKIAALLALLVFLVGTKSVLMGSGPTGRKIRVPDTTIPRSTVEVIPRKYRTFRDDTELPRNPFSFSEGWQGLETIPMDLPPLGPAPRPIPSLGRGPTSAEAGFLYMDRLPESQEKEESSK